MASKSGQRFIKENRAPRVHIEYEVATGDARQMVDLADQASSLLYAGSLRNPLHRGEGAG